MDKREENGEMVLKAVGNYVSKDEKELLNNATDDCFKSGITAKKRKSFIEKVTTNSLSDEEKDQLVQEYTVYETYIEMKSVLVGRGAAIAAIAAIKEIVKRKK